MKGIGTLISTYRKKKGLNQSELAELVSQSGNVHVTNKAISSWEQARTEPNATVFMHLCKVLEISDCLEDYFGMNEADPLSVLNDAGKREVEHFISILAKTDEYTKNPGGAPHERVSNSHKR